MNFIPGWDDLFEEKEVERGTPDEYVVFATLGSISSPFNDKSLTATATIGQCDKEGRLFRSKIHGRHFCPRKFTITKKNAEAQIRVLHSLTAGLNNGTIAPGFIPRNVSSLGDWDAIRNLLKVSGGAGNA